ncbi:MAG TPA: HEAT repeat domain-containing protein [Sedimentisphaerales bacterium]|nr:HEAT repeat domain-containing protein [Sedimentisphaerales bacterium]
MIARMTLTATLTLMAVLLISGQALAEPTEAEIRQAISEAAKLDYGQSDETLRLVDEYINATNGNSQLRGVIEQELVAILESDARLAAKQFACRRLLLIGTDTPAPILSRMLASDDPRVAEAACYAMASHPSAAMIKTLREALGKAKGSGLIAVINLVGDIRDYQSVRLLKSLATSQNGAVADAAIGALGRIASESAIQVLQSLLAGENSAQRRAAAKALLEAGQELERESKTSEARTIYKQLYAVHWPAHVRRGALLGSVRLAGPHVVSQVLWALNGTDEAIKATAIAQVPGIEGEEATLSFARILSKLATEQQVLMIGALADRGDPLALPAIVEATGYSNTAVRVTALKALGRFGDTSSVPVLLKCMAEDDSEVGTAARQALLMIAARGADELILERMKSVEGRYRGELIRILAERRYEGALPVLFSEAGCSDADVSREALRALRIMGKPGDIPKLIKVLKDQTDPGLRRYAEQAVAYTAQKAETPAQGIDVVLTAYGSNEHAEIRDSLLRVVGMLRDQRSYEIVLKACEDPDAKIKDTAVRLLCNWPNPAAADPLFEIVRSTSNPQHRALAFRGLIRLTNQLKEPTDRIVKIYAGLIPLTRDVDEIKLLLSGLAEVEHVEALAMATVFLDDNRVRAEAQYAAVQIAESLRKEKRFHQRIERSMQTVLKTCDDKKLSERARKIVREIEGLQ